MKNENWKISAIVSMIIAVILLFALLVETAIFGIFITVGLESIEKEDQCAAFCSEQGVFYIYDDDTEECSCIGEEGEVIPLPEMTRINIVE